MTDTPIYDTVKAEYALKQSGIYTHKGLHGDFGYVWCSWCGGDWDGPEKPEDDPCVEVPIDLLARHRAVKASRDNGRITQEKFMGWVEGLPPEYRVFLDGGGDLLV